MVGEPLSVFKKINKPFDMPKKKWMIINFLSFQLVWLLSVLSASTQAGWAVLLLVIVLTLAQLQWLEGWLQAVPVLLTAMIGCLFDQIMLMAGWIQFQHYSQLGDWPFATQLPWWMMALWLGFASTLNVSMRWLQPYMLMAAVLGAIFGPLAYLGAEKLGAVQLPYPLWSLCWIAIEWAIALPLLLWIRRSFNQHVGIDQP